MSKYVLPDLPYDYAALEPHVSGKIMELHHDRHHRAYVEGANKGVQRILEARAEKNFDNIAALEKALAFNISGHVLHSIFWQNMFPGGGGEPQGELSERIDPDFVMLYLFITTILHPPSP